MKPLHSTRLLVASAAAAALFGLTAFVFGWPSLGLYGAGVVVLLLMISDYRHSFDGKF